MEYMPGRPLGDYFENLTYRQKIRAASNLAHAMSSLFKIKATRCGSFSRVRSDDSIGFPVRYVILSILWMPPRFFVVQGSLPLLTRCFVLAQ
jgi:integral membrane sensor domain MASE1